MKYTRPKLQTEEEHLDYPHLCGSTERIGFNCQSCSHEIHIACLRDHTTLESLVFLKVLGYSEEEALRLYWEMIPSLYHTGRIR